jgi:hypothetical protein
LERVISTLHAIAAAGKTANLAAKAFLQLPGAEQFSLCAHHLADDTQRENDLPQNKLTVLHMDAAWGREV